MNPTGAQTAAIVDTRRDTARRTGCTEWDTAGVRAALIATDGATADVLAAAHLAAGDPNLRLPSPAAITQRWHSRASAPPRRSVDVSCADHPTEVMPCRHPDHSGDMTPEQIAEAAAECRRLAAQAADAAAAKRPDIAARRQEAKKP